MVLIQQHITDISIKGSSSGSSGVSSDYGDKGSITASIKGSALSFSFNNDELFGNHTGTVTGINSDGEELLAITSITAY